MILETYAPKQNRKFFVGGNWKCNLRMDSISKLVDALNTGRPIDENHAEIVIAPPSVYLHHTRQILRSDFAVALQNCWVSTGGSYTGEIDAEMAPDVGATWILAGHPERRHTDHILESDDFAARKVAHAIQNAHCKVVFYFGDTTKHRENGTAIDACIQQIRPLLKYLSVSDWDSLVLAYEPVKKDKSEPWPVPTTVESIHYSIRSWISENVSKSVGRSIRITYAGGVTPDNCNDLAKFENIDGFMVGKASMVPTFLEIVNSYNFRE